MALDIIARDKKEIRWKGLPITCKKDVEEVKVQLPSLPFRFSSVLLLAWSSSLLFFLDIGYLCWQMDRNKVMNSVQKKAAFLKELREKVILFHFFYVDGNLNARLLQFKILFCIVRDDKNYWFCMYSRICKHLFTLSLAFSSNRISTSCFNHFLLS